MLLHDLLLEMNVANLDAIKSAFTTMLDQLLKQRGLEIPTQLHAMIIKRAVKAMQNDEEGNMVTREPITRVDLDQPKWLSAAINRGETIYNITFKDGFQTRLAHVVDWLAVDQNAARIVKAAPDENFLGHLAKAADDYFEAYNKAQTSNTAQDEDGREVVMTFRADPQTKTIKYYMESDLRPDPERGPIVAFWAKLTNAASLDREGQMMGHCVGSYCRSVEDRSVEIYSLRDNKNNPHVTLEVDNRSGGPPRINQVKGKQNEPPVGKYAPFIRDFLNELGFKPSTYGRHDLRGVGLLSHNGKYGTMLEVAEIIHTFSNKDTLRMIPSEDNGIIYYVDKNGTVTFSFEANKDSVNYLTLLRDNHSKHKTWMQNLEEYFTENKLESSREAFSEIGLYYDTVNHRWGTISALTKKLFTYKGVVVSQMDTSIFFSYKDVPFAEGRYSQWEKRERQYSQLKNIEGKAQSPMMYLMPELLQAFYEHIGRKELIWDDEKALFADFGVFTTSKGFHQVPENKQIFQSKHGSVRHYRHRFFFYDRKGRFVGSQYVGTGKYDSIRGRGYVTYYNIERGSSHVLGERNYKTFLALVSDMSLDPKMTVVVDKDFSWSHNNPTVDMGFFYRDGTLVPTSQVSFRVTIRGYTVAMNPSEHGGSLALTISRGDDNLLNVRMDNEKLVGYIGSRHIDNEAKSYVEHRAILAAALNVAKARMRKCDILRYALNFKNGRYYPQTNRDVLSFLKDGYIDLGNHFFTSLYQDTLVPSDKARDHEIFGDIEYHAGDSYARWRGTTIVKLLWADSSKRELQYRMVRSLPRVNDEADERISRSTVIKVATKFMRFFHQNFDPLLGNQIVEPTGKSIENDDEDD